MHEGHSAELQAGASVLYRDAHGEQQPAVVLAVHPGGSEDPEPYFTIVLDGGPERDTIRSRLTLVESASPAPPHGMAQQPGARIGSKEEEEEARREAVLRSRREARQERRRRSQEAAARSQEAAAAAEAAAARGRAHPQYSSYPSASYGHNHTTRSLPPRQHPPRPADELDQMMRGAGDALNAAGDSLRGAAEAMTSATVDAFTQIGQLFGADSHPAHHGARRR